MHPGSMSDEDSECVKAVVNGGEKKGVPSLVDGLVWIHASIEEILGESRLVGWWSSGDYNLEKGLPDMVDGVHIESVSQEMERKSSKDAGASTMSLNKLSNALCPLGT